MDKKFIERLVQRTSVYVDGHYSLNTSDHLTIPNFLSSMSSSIRAIESFTPQNLPVQLNTTPNVSGFNERRRGGSVAGAKILEKIRHGEYPMRIDNQGKILDKVDIVCHSMGFAYALGIIDILKQEGIPLGRFYIFAPENACSGEVNVNEWEQVWQYGSDEENHPLWMQDGVAPQCPVGNIGVKRAFIPLEDNTVPKGFVKSHKIENYGWIFTRKGGEPGYVTSRK
jgi:hypothetical protein